MIVEDVSSCGEAAVAINDLATHDTYTLQHSIDTTAVGLLLAQRLWTHHGWIDGRGARRWDRHRAAPRPARPGAAPARRRQARAAAGGAAEAGPADAGGARARRPAPRHRLHDARRSGHAVAARQGRRAPPSRALGRIRVPERQGRAAYLPVRADRGRRRRVRRDQLGAAVQGRRPGARRVRLHRRRGRDALRPGDRGDVPAHGRALPAGSRGRAVGRAAGDRLGVPCETRPTGRPCGSSPTAADRWRSRSRSRSPTSPGCRSSRPTRRCRARARRRPQPDAASVRAVPARRAAYASRMRPVGVIGHLARDVVEGGPARVGGGSWHAARALHLLRRGAIVCAKCAERDAGCVPSAARRARRAPVPGDRRRDDRLLDVVRRGGPADDERRLGRRALVGGRSAVPPAPPRRVAAHRAAPAR